MLEIICIPVTINAQKKYKSIGWMEWKSIHALYSKLCIYCMSPSWNWVSSWTAEKDQSTTLQITFNNVFILPPWESANSKLILYVSYCYSIYSLHVYYRILCLMEKTQSPVLCNIHTNTWLVNLLLITSKSLFYHSATVTGVNNKTLFCFSL